jgi:hypothetical protein
VQFAVLYADVGRPSIPPKQLLRALLLLLLLLLLQSVLHHPVETAADGASRLQPTVQLVRRAV